MANGPDENRTLFSFFEYMATINTASIAGTFVATEALDLPGIVGLASMIFFGLAVAFATYGMLAVMGIVRFPEISALQRFYEHFGSDVNGVAVLCTVLFMTGVFGFIYNAVMGLF